MMKKIIKLAESPCFDCTYDGNKCEDAIHSHPWYRQIKDNVFPRADIDRKECPINIYLNCRGEK